MQKENSILIIRDDKHDEFLSSSFPLRADKLFWLSKCIREWKKVGLTLVKNSHRPRGIREPLCQTLHGFSWKIAVTRRILNLLYAFATSLAFPYSPIYPSILISRPLSSRSPLSLSPFFSLPGHAFPMHFPKTALAPACGNSFRGSFFLFFFSSLYLLLPADSRSK